MKTKEIDVWVFKDTSQFVDELNSHGNVFVRKDASTDPKFIKAKLIVPVEPEVVEHEWDFNGVLKLPMSVLDRLQGRRWKCRFEEIL